MPLLNKLEQLNEPQLKYYNLKSLIDLKQIYLPS